MPQLPPFYIPPKSQELAVEVGGPISGTYSTMTPAGDGGFRRKTWNYNQSMKEQPISEEYIPMKQLDVVKPEAERGQFPGAKVLDFSDSYMVEVHDHANLLSSWNAEVNPRLKIDTLVGTGVSGTLAVAHLARDLGLNYLILRKDNESSHSAWPAEGRLGKNWVFVDDLISSGSTFQRVWDKMNKIQQGGFISKFKGVFLYGQGDPRFIGPDSPGRYRLHGWLRGSATYRGEFESKSKANKKELAW